jgi:diguanylate cyclase (GGDEF)-like protein
VLSAIATREIWQPRAGAIQQSITIRLYLGKPDFNSALPHESGPHESGRRHHAKRWPAMISDHQAKKPIALVVDDDPTVCVMSKETLRGAGFDVVCARDGHSALKLFDEFNPDVVILDIEIPGLNGFAVCESLNQREDGIRVPIIMITSHDDAESVNRAYESGAQDLINKPIPWPVLPHRVRNVMHAKRIFDDLVRSEKRNRALLQAIPDHIHIVNAEGDILEYLSNACDVVSPGHELGHILPDRMAEEARHYIDQALTTGAMQTYEQDLGADRGQFETRLLPQTSDTVLAIVREITDRKQAEAKVRHLAYHDNLTGLPNRQYFANKLRQAIRHARKHDQMLATLYIDLDRFKRINDTLGHRVGDALLKAVAKRLDHSVRHADSIARVDAVDENEVRLARLGGDEFVVLIEGIETEAQVDAVADRIRTSLLAPFKYDGHQFVVTPSIGIALYPRDGKRLDDLMMHADMAMYEAKSSGRNGHRYYSKSMNLRSVERLDLENELQNAIRTNAFEVYYQPKVNLDSARIVGVEALLRWQHPERGWIPPAQFIPIAEETGLVMELGNWVVQQACQQVKTWQRKGINDISVAINVSSRQFCRDDLLDSVLRIVWDSGIRPENLELEITESMLMRDVDDTRATLHAFKDAGLRISVDDFGTGYSSLNYLKQFPIDSLKIDRSFVQDLHRDRDDAAICAAILAMAKELDLSVVAEGVESEEQLEFLRRHRCDQVQGFLFGKPVPPEQFEQTYSANLTQHVDAGEIMGKKR